MTVDRHTATLDRVLLGTVADGGAYRDWARRRLRRTHERRPTAYDGDGLNLIAHEGTRRRRVSRPRSVRRSQGGP